MELSDALSFYVYDAGSILATVIAKRPANLTDKGQSLLFHELMHSWVSYEILKVLIIYGLQPTTVNESLSKWSPDLYDVFTYITTRRHVHKANAERILGVLMQGEMHNGHFTKTSFGGKTYFIKQHNTTLSLVILTWLRQLQQFFYGEITKENGNWSAMGKYTPTNRNPTIATSPLSNILFSTYDKQTILNPITSLEHIKPIEDNKKQVCTSLEEWAMRILKPTNTVNLQKLYEMSEETGQRWDDTHTWNKKPEIYPQFSIKDVTFLSSDMNETTENPLRTFNSSSENMKGKSEKELICIVNSFVNNHYTTANHKKNGEKPLSKKELNNIELVFDAASAMTAHANQICEGPKYNNFDEMIVHMNKESTEQPTKKQKEVPVDTDSDRDEDKNLQPPTKKRAKRAMFLDEKQLSDEDDEDYNEIIHLDDDDNSE